MDLRCDVSDMSCRLRLCFYSVVYTRVVAEVVRTSCIDQALVNPDQPPPHTPEATLVTDLVSFVSPPLVHSIGLLGGEHGHVVPVGLGNKGLLQWVESQAGARVSLLVAK